MAPVTGSAQHGTRDLVLPQLQHWAPSFIPAGPDGQQPAMATQGHQAVGGRVNQALGWGTYAQGPNKHHWLLQVVDGADKGMWVTGGAVGGGQGVQEDSAQLTAREAAQEQGGPEDAGIGSE